MLRILSINNTTSIRINIISSTIELDDVDLGRRLQWLHQQAVAAQQHRMQTRHLLLHR